MKTDKTEKRTFLEDLQLIMRGIRIWLEICPQTLLYNIITQIFNMVSPYFSLYMSALLINELSGGCRQNVLLELAAATVLGLFGINILKRLLQGRATVWEALNYHRIEMYLCNIQNKMQYEHLENPNIAIMRQQITAVSNSNGFGLRRLTWSIPALIGNIFNLIMSVSLTISIFQTNNVNTGGFLAFINSPGSAILLIAILFLNAVLYVKTVGASAQKELQAWAPLAKSNTVISHYNLLFGTDVPIFGMKDMIMNERAKYAIKPPYLAMIEKIKLKYNSINIIQNTILNLTVFIITAAKAFIGVFGIGSFVLYRGTVMRFVGAIAGITGNYANLRENNRYLLTLFQFLDLPNTMYQGNLAVEKRDDIDYEIEFKNVSFQYPNSDNWVLRNVNMKFKIGHKLAIVGENGSGKTTFIKLLCRLYDPTEGNILLNGIDITKYRYDEYMALFSVVFQDYMLFDFPLGVNVAATFQFDKEKVRNSLERAGLGEKLRSLEHGADTSIGRSYENDGTDLSGGEGQKVALARALYKDAPFVILDEPTAALDPLAEAAVYESLQNLVKEKTAIFISHRLSSCRFCDDIIVFHKGMLIQRGNHDTLAAEEGKYSQLWAAQAQYYAEENIS